MLFNRKKSQSNVAQLRQKPASSVKFPDFIPSPPPRHPLDVIYEQFSKPQLNLILKKDEPSIYIRHTEGQIIRGNYQVEKVFEDKITGFYAEGRVALAGNAPPVLVIRGYGSWYPFDGVLQDTPEVFLAHLNWQSKAAETQGAIDWIKEKCHQGDRPDVIGESLGGKIAQQLGVQYSDRIRSVVTFNPLGVSRKLVQSSSHP
ncbi:MAG TPA: hypothetical protein V6D27_07360, partial [Vampirovibrionales bacterium]